MSLDDCTDLYTRWKHDEQLSKHETPPLPGLINPKPFKYDASKFLVPTTSEILYTDGYSGMKEDNRYARTLFDEEMEVPSIGTDKNNFDMAEAITFDISGPSTRLPLMCKMIIYQQGATHEREPPILVRDVCIQWDSIDRSRCNSIDSLLQNSTSRMEYGLQRARSSDYLLGDSVKSTIGRFSNDIHQCTSMASSMTDDDDRLSVMTVGGSIRHRVSPLLHRYKYQRQIDTNLVGRYEFYSVPFYQYRGRRYGQKHAETQTNQSDLNRSSSDNTNSPKTTYSVTIIFNVPDRNDPLSKILNNSRTFQLNVPINTQWNHTTIAYIHTKQFITIKRTINGRVVEN